MLHRIKGFISYQLMRLLFRFKLDKKIQEAAGKAPHFVDDKLSKQLERLSDSELNLMVAECDKGHFDEEILRLVEMFKAVGVDVIQGLRNEKFLRIPSRGR